MTTAHRPTWTPAVGSSSTSGNWATGGISWQFSAKDEPGHKKLKFRQFGQNSEIELKKRDLKATLEADESKARESKKSGLSVKAIAEKESRDGNPMKSEPLLLLESERDVIEKAKKYDDRDDDDSESELSDSSEDESDDDLEALQQELEKIKKEKEEERARREAEENEILMKEKQEAAMNGNILLSLSQGSSQVKRKWNDDVVFKGQARNEPQGKKRFVNDTIRSDFHRSFLKKYVH